MRVRDLEVVDGVGNGGVQIVGRDDRPETHGTVPAISYTTHRRSRSLQAMLAVQRSMRQHASLRPAGW
jgi:hypothetical protein